MAYGTKRTKERASEAKRTGEKEDTMIMKKRYNKFIFLKKNCAHEENGRERRYN